MAELSGRCLCGGVRFKVNGEILSAGHCHCESCRRATSSPVTTFFTVRRSDAEIGGSLRFYASSPGVKRGFCGNCGSPMSFQTDERPNEMDFYVASLSDGLHVEIHEHWHWDERVDWLNVTCDLPKGS